MAPICQTRDFERCLFFLFQSKKKGLLVCRFRTSATIITFTIQTNI